MVERRRTVPTKKSAEVVVTKASPATIKNIYPQIYDSLGADEIRKIFGIGRRK